MTLRLSPARHCTWKNITALTSASTTLYGKKDGGIVYANVGVVVMSSSTAAPSSGDVEYGFVTADSSLVKNGDDYYVSMTIWNGSSEVSVKADSYYEFNNSTSAFTTKTDVDDGTAVKNYTNASSQKITSAFNKKTPVSYKTTGDGIISEVRPLNVVDGDYLGAVAVTGYSGKKFVSLDGTDYDLTSDTVQMFVDTDAKTGAANGSITEANEVHGYFVKTLTLLRTPAARSSSSWLILRTTSSAMLPRMTLRSPPRAALLQSLLTTLTVLLS